MDKEAITIEILSAENQLLTLLRQGKILEGVGMHRQVPDYRNIWNGEIKTYEQLKNRLKAGLDKGLKSIDYQEKERGFLFIDMGSVIETLTVTETTTMASGQSTTSRGTAISILWQKIDDDWPLGYLHASELPEEKNR